MNVNHVNLLKLKLKLLDLYLDIPCVIIARQITDTPLGYQADRQITDTPLGYQADRQITTTPLGYQTNRQIIATPLGT